MDLTSFLWSALLCLIPISELRGGLPLLLASGAHPLVAYLFCAFINSLVSPLLVLFLNTINKLLLKLKSYRSFYEKTLERARRKVQPKVERWGFWGLAVFVAIPLPLTGAYTGVLGGWILGLRLKQIFLAVTAGVWLAGLLVLGAYYLAGLGYDFFRIFIK